MSDWMTSDDVRKQVVTQSLASRRTDLRRAADQCRKAYTKDYMNIPCTWLANAYDEAASVLEAKLAEIAAALPPSDRPDVDIADASQPFPKSGLRVD